MSEATKQNFRLRRNAEGEILPLEGVSPTLGIQVKVKPITYGDSRNLETFHEPIVKWSDTDKLWVLQNNLIEPDLNITDLKDMYDNHDAWTIEDLVQAVAVYSGLSRLFGDAEGNEDGEGQDEA